MNQEERQVITDIFERLRQVADQPRDPEAERLVAEKVRQQPYAPYALAQAVYVQEQAVANLDAEVQQLRGEVERLRRQPQGGGGFLSSIFGGSQQSDSQQEGSPSSRPGRSLPGYGAREGAPAAGPWGGMAGAAGAGPMQSRGGGFSAERARDRGRRRRRRDDRQCPLACLRGLGESLDQQSCRFRHRGSRRDERDHQFALSGRVGEGRRSRRRLRRFRRRCRGRGRLDLKRNSPQPMRQGPIPQAVITHPLFEQGNRQ